MRKNFAIALAVIVLGFGLGAVARAQDDQGPMSSVGFVVLRDTDGKPVRNAQVVLHPLKSKGKETNPEMELKTDGDGKASIDGIPYGPLRVQVLAPHFQTFGQDYEIDKPRLEITVKLKHPGGQYSIYDNH
ncbi:MAG: carboxypeptidase-like regulatory domain-containing protein [Terriglobales bacterium]